MKNIPTFVSFVPWMTAASEITTLMRHITPALLLTWFLNVGFIINFIIKYLFLFFFFYLQERYKRYTFLIQKETTFRTCVFSSMVLTTYYYICRKSKSMELKRPSIPIIKVKNLSGKKRSPRTRYFRCSLYSSQLWSNALNFFQPFAYFYSPMDSFFLNEPSKVQ